MELERLEDKVYVTEKQERDLKQYEVFDLKERAQYAKKQRFSAAYTRQ